MGASSQFFGFILYAVISVAAAMVKYSYHEQLSWQTELTGFQFMFHSRLKNSSSVHN